MAVEKNSYLQSFLVTLLKALDERWGQAHLKGGDALLHTSFKNGHLRYWSPKPPFEQEQI